LQDSIREYVLCQMEEEKQRKCDEKEEQEEENGEESSDPSDEAAAVEAKTAAVAARAEKSLEVRRKRVFDAIPVVRCKVSRTDGLMLLNARFLFYLLSHLWSCLWLFRINL
jgi:hypothetical protein